MGTVEREWVSLKEAAETIGISITTIRDWSRAGQLEMRETANGRFIDLAQVREKAMGPAARKRRPSDLQDRVADGVAATDSPERLTSTLQQLQELARERRT